MPLTEPARSMEPSSERLRQPAVLDLISLGFCLLGLLGLITVLLQLKSGIHGVPRLLFLTFLAMLCAPFYVALWGTPKPVFLVAPVVAIFLIYPIAAPSGVPFLPDPIFNYSFTERLATTRFWVPGSVSGLSYAYSFYPLGNVFMAYIILTASLPAQGAFLWIEPVLRLLAIPATVYAIGRRLFSARIAILGLFLYMGTASILFNSPVQQGVGVIFVALALLSLVMLSQSPTAVSQRRAQLLFALVGAGIVMTHHLSSYIFAAWLAGLAVIMAVQRIRPTRLAPRYGILALYYFAVLALYIALFTNQIFLAHEQNLELSLQRLIAPESLPTPGKSPNLGRTFSSLEVVWVAGAFFGLLGLALFSIVSYRRSGGHPFAVANAVVAAILIFLTLPLLATGADFVPLRMGEFANLFLAPFAAMTLVRGSRLGWARRLTFARSVERTGSTFQPAVALGLAAALFIGGSLVPATLREYFVSPEDWGTDTSMLVGPDAKRLAAWGKDHYGEEQVWGDQLTVGLLVGFATMQVEFGNSRIFANSTLGAGEWAILSIGDYVAVSRSMLNYSSEYYLESTEALRPPLSAAAIEKFARDPHFSLVYQDEQFSIYRVVSRPS